jgi:hypothetical protein
MAQPLQKCCFENSPTCGTATQTLICRIFRNCILRVVLITSWLCLTVLNRGYKMHFAIYEDIYEVTKLRIVNIEVNWTEAQNT